MQTTILEEILKLPNSNFQDELVKASRMTLASQFRTLTTASGRASDLASNWHETRNLNFTRDYLDQITSVTTEDLQRVARTYLVPDKLTITSLDPEESQEGVQVKRSRHNVRQYKLVHLKMGSPWSCSVI